MNFELIDLRAFIAVADLGSFHRAAKALNLSQPALSRRIQKLEESFGAPLLERSTRHVALTMVGRDFIPKVRRFLDEFETSVLSIRDLGARSGGLVVDRLGADRRILFPAARYQPFQCRLSPHPHPHSGCQRQ